MAEEPLQCYFVDPANIQQGPVGSSEIVRLVRDGTIRRDTLIWHTGMTDWRPASEVTGLASLFAGAAPPARAPGGPPLQGAPMQRRAPRDGYPGSQPPAGSPDAVPNMGFVDAVKTVFRKYVGFSGRARRAEYWWFMLFYFLLMIVLVILDTVIALAGVPVSVFSTLGSLGMLLPSLSVAVRRLHDTDRSGWWILLGFIPLVGGIVLLVFVCQRGTVGPNRFGEDPLSAGVAATFE